MAKRLKVFPSCSSVGRDSQRLFHPIDSAIQIRFHGFSEPFVYDFRYAPTPQERKVSRETCGAIGQYLIDVVIDFTPWAGRFVALATRGFLRSALTRLASRRSIFPPRSIFLENLWDQGNTTRAAW